jgi:glycosyltransferase involved in cell wall biosynthesis
VSTWLEVSHLKVCFVMCHTGEEFGILSDSQYSRHFGFEQWYCKAMIDQGWDVTLIVLSHRPRISQFRHIFGHKIISVPVSLSFGVSRQLSTELFGLIKTDLKDIDVFHINSFYALLYEPLALFLKQQKKKFVVQSQSSQYSLTNPIHLARLCVLFFSLRLPDRVLTVNPLEYAKLTKMYKLRNAISFPNGVDTDIYRDLHLERRQNSLLYVGRLWPEKGLDVLFTAFEIAQKKIPDLSLTLVGRGPLEVLVKEMQRKYGDKIRYLSYVTDRHELTKIYNIHELFVLPSLKEPFGIVVIESLACQTPVIAANNCGAALFLKRYNCVETVAPSDPVDLSNKIVCLLKDPSKLQDMGKRGRDAVVANFDWKILGKKLADIYDDVLKG